MPCHGEEMSHLCHNYNRRQCDFTCGCILLNPFLFPFLHNASKTGVASRSMHSTLYTLSVIPFFPFLIQFRENEQKARARLTRFARHARLSA